MILERLSPENHAEWDSYIATKTNATCYHLREWRHAAQCAYGMEAPHLLVRDKQNGPLRGILPLFIAGPSFRRYVTNALYGGYGSLLCDHREAENALIEESKRITHVSGANYLHLKTMAEDLSPYGLTRTETCAHGLLALKSSHAQHWRDLRREIRNKIRKAQNANLHLHVGTDALSNFYDVLAANMHRIGTPIYGFPFIRELSAAADRHCELLTLWQSGRCVSGAFLVELNSTLYVPFASSRWEARSSAPNSLLYWEIIKRGCERGLTHVDFGRSPYGTTRLQYKERWGATLHPQPFWVYVARGGAPLLEDTGASARLLIKLWQSMPRAVADHFGPSIAKRFLV